MKMIEDHLVELRWIIRSLKLYKFVGEDRVCLALSKSCKHDGWPSSSWRNQEAQQQKLQYMGNIDGVLLIRPRSMGDCL